MPWVLVWVLGMSAFVVSWQVGEVVSCKLAFSPPGKLAFVLAWVYVPHEWVAGCLMCKSTRAGHDEVEVHI